MIKLGIVDDEDLVRAAIKKSIRFDELGVELCFEASDGLEALELCVQYKPDILITDIRMPGLTGTELVQELKGDLPLTRVIILSGFNDFEYARTAIKYGVRDYLLKPVNEFELNELLIAVTAEIESEKQKVSSQKSFMNQYAKALPTLIETLFNRLIAKSSIPNASILKELQEYGVHFDFSSYRMLLLSSDTPSLLNGKEYKREQFKSNIIKMAEKSFHAMAFPIANSPFDIAILLSDSAGLPAHMIKRKLTLISLLFERSFDSSLSISISSHANNIASVSRLYSECCMAMNMRFWEDNPQKLKLYKYQKTQYAEMFPLKLEELNIGNLAFDIESHRVDLLKEHIDSIFVRIEALDRQNTNPEQVKELIWAVIQGVINKLGIYSSFLSFESVILGVHPRKRMDEISSVKLLKEFLLEILQGAGNFYEEQCRYSSGNPIENAKGMIEQNYSRDISLELISNYVHLSQTYFSYQFKKETGMSFTQYKTLLKIEKAKTLLQETNLSITQIGSKVGYNDSKYFSRMFKKVTGLTPKEFRE